MRKMRTPTVASIIGGENSPDRSVSLRRGITLRTVVIARSSSAMTSALDPARRLNSRARLRTYPVLPSKVPTKCWRPPATCIARFAAELVIPGTVRHALSSSGKSSISRFRLSSSLTISRIRSSFSAFICQAYLLARVTSPRNEPRASEPVLDSARRPGGRVDGPNDKSTQSYCRRAKRRKRHGCNHGDDWNRPSNRRQEIALLSRHQDVQVTGRPGQQGATQVRQIGRAARHSAAIPFRAGLIVVARVAV